jgi:hypothetical protein
VGRLDFNPLGLVVRQLGEERRVPRAIRPSLPLEVGRERHVEKSVACSSSGIDFAAVKGVDC